jgi:hypothetical protein
MESPPARTAPLPRNLRVIRHRGEAATEARQNPRRQRNIYILQHFNKSTGSRSAACQESLRVHTRTLSAALILDGNAALGLTVASAAPIAATATTAASANKAASARAPDEVTA